MCLTHPDAAGVVESPKFGGIRTERGEPGYVVSVSHKMKNDNGEEMPFVQWTTEKVSI